MSTANTPIRGDTMMPKIETARAWCNNEVAYLAWKTDAKIPDCLGFMITRVHTSGVDKNARRVLRSEERSVGKEC